MEGRTLAMPYRGFLEADCISFCYCKGCPGGGGGGYFSLRFCKVTAQDQVLPGHSAEEGSHDEPGSREHGWPPPQANVTSPCQSRPLPGPLPSHHSGIKAAVVSQVCDFGMSWGTKSYSQTTTPIPPRTCSTHAAPYSSLTWSLLLMTQKHATEIYLF